MSEQIDPRNLDQARERLREQARSVPRLLTIPEVAELVRCEHKAVRKAIHEGLLPATAPNRKLLVDESDVVAWLEARRVTTPAPRAPRAPRKASTRPGSVQALREIERNLTR